MTTTKPPPNAKRVYRWDDLPPTLDAALYSVADGDGEVRIISASRRKRQVLEGLMRAPLFAASYCRISDKVLPLRRDDGIDIECEMYRNDPETGRERYGVYVLKSKVERIDQEGAA